MEKHALILATTGDFLEKFEREDAKLLKELGYTVHYGANLCEPPWFSGEERLRRMGVVPHHLEIARSPFLVNMNFKALLEVLRLIDAWGITLIHCHTPVGGLVGRLAGRLSPRRPVVIYTAHGFHFYTGAPLRNWLAYFPAEWYLARYTDFLAVINREDLRLSRRLPLPGRGRARQIPGTGLNRKRFSPASPEERERARRRLGVGERFFLVSAGEINENKNHRTLLEALLILEKRPGGLEGLCCGICGGGFYRERMKGWIRSRGLSGMVKLYGHCEDMREFLAAADLFVFPSRREGLGMAALEALSMGIPVLAADNRGTREYIRPGKNGLLCPWDSPEAFARGIISIRRLPEARKSQMRAACIRSARPFDISHSREAMRKLYREADLLAASREGGKGDAT